MGIPIVPKSCCWQPKGAKGKGLTWEGFVGIITDFLNCVLYPEKAPKDVITSISFGTDICGLVKNNIISAAYSDKWCCLVQVWAQWILRSCLIASVSGLITIANNRGGSGHHCLVPLQRANCSEHRLFICNYTGPWILIQYFNPFNILLSQTHAL